MISSARADKWSLTSEAHSRNANSLYVIVCGAAHWLSRALTKTNFFCLLAINKDLCISCESNVNELANNPER